MAGAVHFGAAILASFGLACASTVDVKLDRRKDLAGFCTWNFLPISTGNVRALHTDAKALNESLTQLLERGLEERGFVRVADRPDFLVTFYLDVRRQSVMVSETGAMQTLNGMHADKLEAESYEIQTTQTRVETWEIGRLWLFVSDPEERAVVWKADYQGRYRGEIPPRLPDAVSSLLELMSEPIEVDAASPAADAPISAGAPAQCGAPPA